MTQDRQGFLWVATPGNLYRCDGLMYLPLDRATGQQPFTGRLVIAGIAGGGRGVLCLFTGANDVLFYDVGKNSRRFASLNNADSGEEFHITCVSEDTAGRFWFGTREGHVLRISPPDTVAEHVLRCGEGGPGAVPVAIRVIAHDSLGNVWIGGDRGLLKWREPAKTESQFGCDTVHGLPSTSIASLLVVRSGRIWVCDMNGGVGWIDPHNWDFTPVAPLDTTAPDAGATRMSEDRNGSIWVSFKGRGIQRWNEEGGRWERHLQSTDAQGVTQSVAVVSALTDRSGILLVMTDAGRLLRYLPIPAGIHAYVASEDTGPQLGGQDVCALLVDRTGTLWVGRESGGLEYLEPGGGTFHGIARDPRNKSGLSSNSIECMTERRNGEIWIGTAEGGVNILDRTSLRFRHFGPRPEWGSSESRAASTLYEDPQGILWIGHSRGVDTAGPGSATPAPFFHWPEDVTGHAGRVTAIRRDSQGDLWVGTERGGLLRVNPARRQPTWYRHDRGDSLSLASDNVNAVFEDREGRIWIATDAGLSLLDRAAGRFENNERRLPRRQHTETTAVWHLQGEGFVGIVQDRQGDLWATCVDGGIARFDIQRRRFHFIGPREGMAYWSGRRGALYITREGIVYHGGTGGINRLDPERFNLRPSIPGVAITSFSVGETATLVHPVGAAVYELAYDQNDVAFEFAMLDYQNTNWNARAYVLEGWDEDWRAAGPERSVEYRNLPPGTYTFRIRGMTSDGFTPESEASLKVVVRPPFWQAWWFRSLVIALLGSVLYATHRNRLSRARAAERLRLRIADDIHDDIGSELSGIALESDLIARLLPPDSSAHARLTNVSRAIRSASEDLRDVVWIVTPELDSVPHLVARMRSIASRMLVGLRYTFVSPADSTQVSLGLEFKRHMLMMFKEMLNNLVRHSKATAVEIEVNLQDGRFRLCVADNGTGFDVEAQSDGRGLASLRTRAEAVGGILTIESKHGAGTRVCVEADIIRSGD